MVCMLITIMQPRKVYHSPRHPAQSAFPAAPIISFFLGAFSYHHALDAKRRLTEEGSLDNEQKGGDNKFFSFRYLAPHPSPPSFAQ